MNEEIDNNLKINRRIEAGRSTKLMKNNSETLRIELIIEEGNIQQTLTQTYFILGESISPSDHFALGVCNQKMVIMVPPETEYMFINSSPTVVYLKFSENPDKHTVLYDPFLYEKEKHVNIDPKSFQKEHEIPDGFIDILTKWYSIKFTYPDYNLIFVRPGIGISLQVHQKREEHWEILDGKPIIIADHTVSYNTPKGTKFKIPVGARHTIINGSKSEWASLIETYKGEFDEEDIVRVFNPNHYY